MNRKILKLFVKLPRDVREIVETDIDSYLYETIHKPNQKSCIDHLKQCLWWYPESGFHPLKPCKKIANLLLLDEGLVTGSRIHGNLLNYLMNRGMFLSKNNFASYAVLDDELYSLARANCYYMSISHLYEKILLECTRSSVSVSVLSIAYRNRNKEF